MDTSYFQGRQLGVAQNYLGTTRKLLSGWLGISIDDYLAAESHHLPIPPAAQKRLTEHIKILGDFMAIIHAGRKPSEPKPIITTIRGFEVFVGVPDPDFDALTRLYGMFWQATRMSFDYVHVISGDFWLEDYQPIWTLSFEDIKNLDLPSWMLKIRSYCQDILTDPDTVKLISKGGAKNG